MSRKKVLEDFLINNRFELIKSKIEHEDNLISIRINWLLAIQGILITAYVANYKNFAFYLQAIVILFGLISALNISANICMGERSLSRIRSFFKSDKSVYGFLFPQIIYGTSEEDEKNKRQDENAIIEDKLKIKDFDQLNDYDKRLLLGDYDSSSSFIKAISKTRVLSSLCILCWSLLIVVTIYTDINKEKDSPIKVEVVSNGTTNAYTVKELKN